MLEIVCNTFFAAVPRRVEHAREQQQQQQQQPCCCCGCLLGTQNSLVLSFSKFPFHDISSSPFRSAFADFFLLAHFLRPILSQPSRVDQQQPAGPLPPPPWKEIILIYTTTLLLLFLFFFFVKMSRPEAFLSTEEGKTYVRARYSAEGKKEEREKKEKKE